MRISQGNQTIRLAFPQFAELWKLIDFLVRKDFRQANLGDWNFAGIPAEYFVEHQLRIKTETFPKRSFVVGGANGMIGYVPTKDAFTRGGYETTLGPPSRMAPETGELLAETAIKLIKNMS